MHKIMPHRHPFCCVVPPYILERVSERAGRHPAEAAARTLTQDASLRVTRTVQSVAAQTAPKTADQKPGARVSARRAARPAVRINRTIYTTRNTQNLPGDVARTEASAASGDVAVDEAYDGLGSTFDFFSQIFERNSIDNNGLPLKASVHYGTDYGNAFWNGQQMVFGDGDGVIFNRFTGSLDIIGHELTHGVTMSEVHLLPIFQPGALGESVSDVFGSLIKQWTLNQDAQSADWLIGAELFTENVNGVALRSMKDPGNAYDDPVLGKDPQPRHMRDYVHTINDFGGVHINCSIPNLAFYLLATSLGGFAWERAGRIWYETVTDDRMWHHMTFARFAQLTLSNAVRLYGNGSEETEAVQDAWEQVGIVVD